MQSPTHARDAICDDAIHDAILAPVTDLDGPDSLLGKRQQALLDLEQLSLPPPASLFPAPERLDILPAPPEGISPIDTSMSFFRSMAWENTGKMMGVVCYESRIPRRKVVWDFCAMGIRTCTGPAYFQGIARWVKEAHARWDTRGLEE